MGKKKKNRWKKYFFEFLSIFVGVSLAFAMSKWNEDLREDQSASKILMEIQNGLAQDTVDINHNINGHEKGIEAAKYMTRLIQGAEANTDSIEAVYITTLFRDFISIQNKTGYETIKSKGLELIKNDSLRHRIISLYDFDYEILEKIEEDYGEMQFHKSYFRHINDILSPHLIYGENGRLTDIKSLSGLPPSDKNTLLTYLQKIRYNRNFAMSIYKGTKRNIDTLIMQLDKEVR